MAHKQTTALNFTEGSYLGVPIRGACFLRFGRRALHIGLSCKHGVLYFIYRPIFFSLEIYVVLLL